MCNKAVSTRLRISEIVDEMDEHEAEQHPAVFKYVRMQDQCYYIPKLEYIEKSLGL
ncbi:hypothetical protein [Acinetobacter baumannii]|uniref:hypothetical protein n=1 Tax=Acinetobacter baumannii TaxID=470 RepID=UPI0003A9309C|nr:hypothetical protein [Acinetobacter baumannii]